MNIIDLVRRKGIEPRKASSAKGGEYHSSCPMCGDGGKGAASDRFHVWPEQNEGEGSFWCRACSRGGDAIALLMAMDGLGYKEACASLGKDLQEAPPVPERPSGQRRRPAAEYKPSEYQKPADVWREHAEKFVQWAHGQLVDHHPDQMRELADRGIDPGTVIRWHLGWNPGKDGKDLFREREAWGLPDELKDDGSKKKLWLPRGLVIPYRRDGVLQRVNIRRPKEHLRNDHDPRYYVVPGSSGAPWLIGENRKAYVVVETELDALLIDQEASDLVGVLALGSSHKMPDEYCHPHMAQSLVILNALDFDQAGGKAWGKWQLAYQQAKRWPVPAEKDPGDAYKAGVDIATWILAGLPPAWHVGPARFMAQGKRVEEQVKGTIEGQGKASPAQEKPKEQPPEQSRRPQLPESVVELGDIVRRYPVRIIETPERTAIEAPSGFTDQKVRKRLSELVFYDQDCRQYLLGHPEDVIVKGNFFY